MDYWFYFIWEMTGIRPIIKPSNSSSWGFQSRMRKQISWKQLLEVDNCVINFMLSLIHLWTSSISISQSHTTWRQAQPTLHYQDFIKTGKYCTTCPVIKSSSIVQCLCSPNIKIVLWEQHPETSLTFIMHTTHIKYKITCPTNHPTLIHIQALINKSTLIKVWLYILTILKRLAFRVNLFLRHSFSFTY